MAVTDRSDQNPLQLRRALKTTWSERTAEQLTPTPATKTGPSLNACGRIADMSEGTSGFAGSARKRWDLALSYASTDRPYVERVAAVLKAKGIRCYYDVDEQADMWGKYLTEELPRIYGEDATAVVIFSSAQYASSNWTTLERRSALNRAATERREYILPARFDDSPLPGILSDLVAIDLRSYTPEKFAAIVVEKLSSLGVHGAASADPPSAELSSVGGRFNLFSNAHADPVEMVPIPSGSTTVFLPTKPISTLSVHSFAISRYPITIASFRSFVLDSSGYRDDRWWTDLWERASIQDATGRITYEPRISAVSPYAPAIVMRGEAVAYCRWLSIRNQMRLVIPTISHWMRAARGDSRQQYPWGNHFDRSRCNCWTRNVKLQPVSAHPNGSSYFGVEDLVGNCPEWVNIFFDGTILWETTGQLHDWGSWSNSKDHLAYACDYPGDWSQPLGRSAGFRVCTISAISTIRAG